MREPAYRGRRLSVEEYLAREERAERRHEYVDGYVYAMSGPRVRHMKIAGNIFAHLRGATRGTPCEVFMTDAKVRIGDERFYYPDVITIRTPIDDDDVYVTDPCLVVEVTSPGTRATDRREKLVAYGKIDALQAYLVVDHRRRFVEWYVRDADGLRLHADVAGDGAIDLACPRATLTLDTIYDGVTLPALRGRAPSYNR